MKRYNIALQNGLEFSRTLVAWLVCFALIVQPTLVYALPTGGVVSGGDATISANSNTLTVNQSTQRALINWTGFDIGGAESVQFNQPGTSSITLNRVNSASASQINGSLSANGQVWIINQNGVMFGQGAQVNVGGLLATTADIADDNFMNGNFAFNIAGNPAASIVNDGSITVADAGIASLVAPVVRNNGVIQAKLGTVNLASGDTFAVDLYGDGLINIEASAALQQQLVSNSGLIQADGGSVYLTAAAAGDMVDSLINMDGIIQANSIGEKNGTVVLYAEGSNAVKGNIAENKGQKQGVSTVLVSGTIEATGTAAGEKGGNIDVLGDHVGIMSGGFIDASGQIGGGKIRIGGDYFGGADTPTALATLVQRNTTIKANAIESGNGGRLTFWADDTTWFGGNVEAKGGALSGDGGFVEVSGKQYLTFKGSVNTLAANGNTGLLLLDPADIVIADGTADSAADGNNTFSGDPSGSVGTILSGDTGPSTIYESELEGIAAGTNISLAATNSITINDLTDNNLNLAQTGGNSVTFTAGAGGFSMNAGDTITTAGGALNITTTGGTSTIGSLATNGGLVTLNTGGTTTVSGVVSGTGTALTKTGSGTVNLNSANTYTGGTTLTAGTLGVGNNSALGTGTLSLNGGTLSASGGSRTLANNVNLDANSTIGGSSALQFDGTFTNAWANNILTVNNTGLTTFGNINLSNDTTDRVLQLSGSGSVVVNGVIANGGGSTASSLGKLGTGLLTLNGNNTYAGGTYLTGGIIEVGHDNALGTGTLRLNSGTLRSAGGARTLSNTVNMLASSTIGGSLDLNFSGSFGNLNGDRTLTINNSGATNFANINISNGATDRILTFDGTGNATVTGVVANGSTSTASGITKAGSGTLTLDGNNTYGGTTTLTAGTLEIGHNNALGTGTLSLNGGTLQGDGVARTLANNVTLAANSTIAGSSALQFDGTFGNLNDFRLLTVNNSALTTFGNINISDSATDRMLGLIGSGNITVNGVIANGSTSGYSSLIINSGGTLTFNGANTYGGGTTLTMGTLVLGNNAALGTGALGFNGGTIQGNGVARTIANDFYFAPSSNIAGSSDLIFTGTGYNGGANTLTVTNSGNTTFNNLALSLNASDNVLTIGGTGNVTVGGTISNGGTSTASGITKTGSGTLTLDGNNTYGGTTTLTAGILEIGHDNALGIGTLRLNSGTLQGDGVARTLANTVTLAANSVIAGLSDLNFNGTFGSLNGDRTLTVNNSGTTTFGNINISDSATDRMFTIGGTGNVVVNGVIANGGTATSSVLVKNGSGSLTLNGNNTYSGMTTVNGLIIIGHNNAFGTSFLNLGFNNSLQGDGVARTLSNNASLSAAGVIGGSSDLTFTGTFMNAWGNHNLTINNSGLTTFGDINLSNDATDRTLIIDGTGNVVIGGTIANGSTSTASGITKISSGTLTLDGNNTYGGTTTLTAGTLEIGHNNALGTGTLSLNGGTLQGDGVARTLANTVTLAANSVIAGLSDLNFNGTFGNLSANRTLTVNNSAATTFGNIDISNSGTSRNLTFNGTGNITVNGVIANGGGSANSLLQQNGSGVLTLNGANTHRNTSISSGIIEIGHDSALGTDLFYFSGGAIRGNGSTRTIANNIALYWNAAINGSSDLVFTGAFNNTSNYTLTLNNSGLTTFNNINLSDSATDRTLQITGAGDMVVNGVIANGSTSTASTIAKLGSGVLTLNGNNTYGGGTYLTGGTIEVGHDSALGTGTLRLNGGTLRSSGGARTLANTVTMLASSTIGGSLDLNFSGSFGNLNGDRTLTINNSGATNFANIDISNGATDRILTFAGTGNATVAGVVSNGSTSTASGITKTGSGTLTLDGNNTYGGTTTLTAGILEIGHNNAVGTGTLVLNGGTLQGDGTARTLANAVTLAADSVIAGLSDLSFNGTFGNVSATRYLEVNNSGATTFGNINISDSATDRSLIFTGTGDVTVNGVVANGGGSTGSGIGLVSSSTLTLNGNNTYGGSFYLQSGTVALGHDNALGTGLTLLYGGTMQGSGGTRTIANNMALWVGSTFAGSTDLVFNGILYNTSNLTLTNNNSGTTTFGNTNLSIDANDNTLTIAGTGNTVISGVIANGGTSTASGITKTGSGTLTLDGTNTYGGNTTLTAGTIEVGNDDAFGTGTLILNGGTLRGDGVARTLANNVTLAASSTIGGSSALQIDGLFGNLTSDVTLTTSNTGGTTFNNIDISANATTRVLAFAGAGDVTVNGIIDDGNGSSSRIMKQSTGVLTLNGANTYSGSTYHFAGTVQVGNDAAFGDGLVWLMGDTTTRGDGTPRTLANTFRVWGNGSQNPIYIAGNSDLTFSGNFGYLDNALNRTVTVNNSGLTTFNNIDISGNATDRVLTLNGTGDMVVSGVIANGSTSTASGIIKDGAGTLTLSGNNTYGGDTTINGGTLRLGAANRIANVSDIIIGAAGTFDMNGFNETVATITNGGAITMGTGNTLTTTGAQTHTGSISGTDISVIANTGNLTFDAVSANTFFAQALAGDIILNDQISASALAGTSITLVADDQFINNFGNTALQTAGAARWLVYSEDSANNTRGGLAGFNRYGCTYNAGSPDCAVGTDTPATGNGFYFNVAPTITITGLTANNKEYDGTTTATLGGTATANGAINGDTITFDVSGVTATFDTKDVGVGKTVTISGYDFVTNMGYLLTQPAAVLANVTAKALTIAGIIANNKVYDGNTTATLAGVGSLVGVIGLETVGFNTGTATFDNANVGTGKTVTGAGFSLNGADAGNYSLAQPTWLANITAAGGGGGGGGGGGSVSSSNQQTINNVLTQLGSRGGVTISTGSTTSSGSVFQYADGVPEPARMDIPPVDDEAPANDQGKSILRTRPVDSTIEINAIIDLDGLLRKGAAKKGKDAKVSKQEKPDTLEIKPAIEKIEDDSDCKSLVGSDLCASKIFSTIGVPNI